MVRVPVSLVRQNELDVVRSGSNEEEGPGHVDIVDRKTRSRVTSLAKAAEWVDGYEPSKGDYGSESELNPLGSGA